MTCKYKIAHNLMVKKSLVFICTSGPNVMIFGMDHLYEMLIKICKGQAPGVAFHPFFKSFQKYN